ncbi:MAG: hypothetical protein HOM58_23920 [Rhodospirillaceae bacterium]|jgi:tripartite-type tricarboxylate transporter receptor subunit TctC|nr:hypothetical protein [Rhodospirillaceae bacterium]MBT5456401.1 hypothetical protein [Rhodospirillaceae bacterium]
MIKSLTLTATAVAALAAFGAPAMAADYFAGKTITVQVPSGSGGTYHVYCQLVQRNLANYIPGNPKTLIQNMPGAGGAKSASYMQNVAPKGGQLIAMIAPGVITTPLVRKVRYDARTFNWLGAPAARAAGVFFWHTTGVTKLQDILDNKTTIASSGFASSGSIFPRLVNATLGAKMKIILGYKGGGAMNLSVEKGETMGRNNFLSGFTGVRPTWLPKKKIIPIIMYGPKSSSPYAQGVPHLGDLLKPGTMEAKMFRVLNTNLEVGQAFYVPPGAPKNVTAILEKSFVKMMDDPEFKRRVEKRRVEHAPVYAKQIRGLIKAGFDAATPDVVREIKARLYTKKSS